MIDVSIEYRKLFWDWCEEQGIICEYGGSKVTNPSVDMWYIKNESHRSWAMLRWM